MAADPQQAIIDALKTAYWMEIETVMNYITHWINLDGIRAEEIKKSLAADVEQELGHAQALARRIKTLGGTVPSSMEFTARQESLQALSDTTDVVAVIRGVIAAEDAAICQYRRLIELSDGIDDVIQELCIATLSDEEAHRRRFAEYLTEYEPD